MSEQKYSEDEFDRAADGGPAGAHRAPEPWWRWLVPFLIILLIVPAVSWGAMYLLTAQTPEAAAPKRAVSTAQTTEQVATPDTAATPSEMEPTKQAPVATAELEPAKPEPTPTNKADNQAKPIDPANVSVAVLNGTRVKGLAGKALDRVKEEGFNGNAANATGWATKVSTVYYADDKYEASAKQIAKKLGISRVVKDKDARGKFQVTVVLKGDYRK